MPDVHRQLAVARTLGPLAAVIAAAIACACGTSGDPAPDAQVIDASVVDVQSATDSPVQSASDAGIVDVAVAPIEGSYVGSFTIEEGEFFDPAQPRFYMLIGYPTASDVLLSIDQISFAKGSITASEDSWRVRFDLEVEWQHPACAGEDAFRTLTVERFEFVRAASGLRGTMAATRNVNGEARSRAPLRASFTAVPDTGGVRSLIAVGDRPARSLAGVKWYAGRPLMRDSMVRLTPATGDIVVDTDADKGIIFTTATLRPGTSASGTFVGVVDASGAHSAPSFALDVMAVDAHITDGGFETTTFDNGNFSTEAAAVAPIAGSKSLFHPAGGGGTLLLDLDVPATATRLQLDYRLVNDFSSSANTTGYRLGVSAVGSRHTTWTQLEDSSFQHSPRRIGELVTRSITVASDWRGQRLLLEFEPATFDSCHGQPGSAVSGFQVDNIRIE